jgi:uncharacterized Fe-S cluster-containing protein
MTSATPSVLPGHDCGRCGVRTCDDLLARAAAEPESLTRCVFLHGESAPCSRPGNAAPTEAPVTGPDTWFDALGREFDFFLEPFPEDAGPREVILPHNPMLTRELAIAPGDLLVGRPLGMSCGCPVTHCGVVVAVDARTGVITWCITGPPGPRERGFKDVGYYSAEAYEGMIRRARTEIRLGARHFFQPHLCMLQWRHSGLVNYVNRTSDGLQVRLEGLWIG